MPPLLPRSQDARAGGIRPCSSADCAQLSPGTLVAHDDEVDQSLFHGGDAQNLVAGQKPVLPFGCLRELPAACGRLHGQGCELGVDLIRIGAAKGDLSGGVDEPRELQLDAQKVQLRRIVGGQRNGSRVVELKITTVELRANGRGLVSRETLPADSGDLAPAGPVVLEQNGGLRGLSWQIDPLAGAIQFDAAGRRRPPRSAREAAALHRDRSAHSTAGPRSSSTLRPSSRISTRATGSATSTATV